MPTYGSEHVGPGDVVRKGEGKGRLRGGLKKNQGTKEPKHPQPCQMQDDIRGTTGTGCLEEKGPWNATAAAAAEEKSV